MTLTWSLVAAKLAPVIEIAVVLTFVQAVIVLWWLRINIRAHAQLTRVTQALDDATDAILVCNFDGRSAYGNRAYRELFAIEKDGADCPSAWKSRFVQPGLADRIMEGVRRGESWHGQHEMRSASRGARTMTLRADAVRDEKGRICGMVAIHTDVSAHREATERQRQFAALVEHSGDFIAMTTLSGEMLYLNRAGRRLVGLDLDGLEVGGHITQYMSPSSADRFRKDVVVAVYAKGSWQGESQLLNFRHGEAIDVDSTVFVVRDPDTNEPTCLAAIHRDIREQQRAKRELTERSREIERAHACIQQQAVELHATLRSLEEANSAKAAFLANISHEVRTPLTAVLGFSDLLIEELGEQQPSAHVVAALKTIKRNGQHLLDLINDILDLSKIEAGKMNLDPSVCRVRDFVEEIDTLFRERMEERGLKFIVKYKGLVPDTIVTDPVRLRQILINLLGNALKFTEKGRVRLAVELLRSADSEPMLSFRVADTGMGIDAATMAKLFEPFTQSEAASRRFGGTGLGLSISRRLAQLLGGDITAQSIVGVGSEFTLTIATGSLDGVPIVSADAKSSGSASTDDTLTGLAAPKLPIRVLLAEDGKDNQRLLDFMLRKAGADVTIADNGLLCIDRFFEAESVGQPFDVILMDVQMPILDGYAATRQLRQRQCTVPIIALTANARPGDREEAFDAGCTDYATKPIVRPVLLQTIAKHTIWDSSRFPKNESQPASARS